MNNVLKLLSVTIMLLVFAIGCNKREEPDPIVDDGTTESDNVCYVDLGLSSGTLWATCNIGADKPEDRGYYFAWGETEPKSFYDWKSYRHSAFVDGQYVLVKYCTNSLMGFNGLADSLTVLEPVDDAAVAQWGEGWRMPTREEFEELHRETTFTWTTLNGVDGRLLTGKNGNSIFLPATGFYLDDELICTGLGIYWSSSLQATSQVSAWSLHFDYENCHVCATYERSRGQCVRAVRVCQ